jgi:hypothetical protein
MSILKEIARWVLWIAAFGLVLMAANSLILFGYELAGFVNYVWGQL